MNPIARFLATGAYVGYAPAASGTFGTLVAIPLAIALDRLAGGNAALLAASILVCAAAAVWSADVFARASGVKDPSAVVSDEIAGYLFAVAFMPATAPRLFAAFVAFRFFDIVKPPPIRQLERLPGGFGIVADDLLAGVAANVVVRLVAGPLGI